MEERAKYLMCSGRTLYIEMNLEDRGIYLMFVLRVGMD